MRHLLVVLMIALLPLRGWVGDAMAVDMAMQQVLMTKSSASSATLAGFDAASTHASAMPEDCPMNVQSTDGRSVEGDQPGETASACNCNSCELCLALASLNLPTLATAVFTPYAEPPSRGTRFSSAERVFNLKPPIS